MYQVVICSISSFSFCKFLHYLPIPQTTQFFSHFHGLWKVLCNQSTTSFSSYHHLKVQFSWARGTSSLRVPKSWCGVHCPHSLFPSIHFKIFYLHRRHYYTRLKVIHLRSVVYYHSISRKCRLYLLLVFGPTITKWH